MREDNYEEHTQPNIGFIFHESYYHPDDRLVRYTPYSLVSRRYLKELLGYYSKYKPKYDTKLIKILIK